MKRNNIEAALDALQTDVASIPDAKIKTSVSGPLNLVETIYGENEALKKENQQLKDEINHLKGEQGKPDIKGKGTKESTDHSSEKERQAGDDHEADEKNNDKKKRRRGAKLPKVTIDREQTVIPVIETLVCDDAPQFKWLTRLIALCWIHDGRHYKKLRPIVPQHKTALDEFLTEYWLFYHRLKAYKKAPDDQQAALLSQAFDTLFSTQTGYAQLDERIVKTRAKRDALLLVLDYPELPLHNNASELAARIQARERGVSLHTMSKAGTKAKDTFMTISQTAKKLGVRTYEYIRDRVSGELKLPSLAQLIREKSLGYETMIEGVP